MADDWDDLFAKASGQQQQDTLATDQEPAVQQQSERRRTKKRRKRASHDGNNNRSRHDDMLAGRLTVPDTTEWPQWTRLGESFKESKACVCWEESAEEDQESNKCCASCGANPLFHKLMKVTSSNSESNLAWPFQMFCAIRNLRCIGVLVARNEVPANQLKRSAHSEANLILQIMREAPSFLPAGEAEILNAKCQTVLNNVDTLLSQIKRKDAQSSSGGDPFFQEAVRLMIACDHIYYRLYYLEISTILPLRGNNFISHPAEYYHIPFLAWEGMDSESIDYEELFRSVKRSPSDNCEEAKLKAELNARYGIDMTRGKDPLKHIDVLSYLHHNRAVETARLFRQSDWIQSSRAKEQFMTELNRPINDNGLSRHETPAPPILSEWRDSCRDKLCNLYAYAAIPGGGAERIKDSMESAGISGGIIEVGAGTGYVASLLKKAGVDVIAWDVRPPGSRKGSSSLNEFHGDTPAFYKVTKGDPSDLRVRFPSLKAQTDDTLLLCYPPPESPMAKEALEAHLAVGGKCLVHIGEFRGLTGSSAFEDLLVRCFYCVDRFPCLAWGTDAAEVTVWIRADTEREKPEQRLLLPCSHCGKAEATKRCRLVRHLAYCSQACSEDKSSRMSLAAHLAINMIPLEVEALTFSDDRHFMPLRQLKKK